MKITIDNKVYGSQAKVMGDGVLSYSKGISSAADSLGMLFSGQLPRDYASLIFLNNPDNGLHTVIHAQGAFTTFEEQGRAYDMRAIYEITDAEFRKMGSLHEPLIAALDKLHRYEQTEYGASNQIEMPTPSPFPKEGELTADEQLLRRCIVYCVVNNRQLFIRLGNDENYYADEVRRSRKLHELLRAIDSLPEPYRGFASVGFSVDSSTSGTRALADHLLVIAHHDDISLWGNAKAQGVLLDWTTGAHPQLLQGPTPDPSRGEGSQKPPLGGGLEGLLSSVAPLLRGFLGTMAATRSQVCSMFQLIPQNIDNVICAQRPDRNSLLILSAAFKGGTGSYRHFEVARKMLPFLVQGVIIKDVTIADILNVYPELRDELQPTDWQSSYKIAEALRENGVADISKVMDFDAEKWDIRTMDPTVFDRLRPYLTDAQLKTLRQKALPFYYEQQSLRCVFERRMTEEEARQLLDHLWNNNRDHYCQFIDEQKVSAVGFLSRESLWRQKYVLHQVSQGKPLTEIPPAIWGQQNELLDESLLRLLDENGIYRKNANLLSEHVAFFEQKGRRTEAVERTYTSILNTKLPRNFDDLLAKLNVPVVMADHFEGMKNNPKLLIDICETPRKLSFEAFADLYDAAGKKKNQLPEGLFDEAFSYFAKGYLREWFRNAQAYESQYVKTVMPACRLNRTQEVARRYVVSQFGELPKNELSELAQKFEAAYKHKPRTAKNQREFSRKMEALGTSTPELLKALKEKGMTTGNLANLYRESRSLKNWFRNHLGLTAFIAAAVVALAIFIPFLFLTVLSHHSPSATPPPRTVVPDTTVIDTLQSPSRLGD